MGLVTFYLIGIRHWPILICSWRGPLNMYRRVYVALVAALLAGCGGTDPDEATEPPIDSPTATATPTATEEQGTPTPTEVEEPETETEAERVLGPPIVFDVDVEPGRAGPETGNAVRGVDMTVTVSAETPLRNGAATLRAEFQIEGIDRDRSRSATHQFEVAGEGEFETFDQEVPLETNPYPGGEYRLTVELVPTEWDARSEPAETTFAVTPYNIRELEQAEEYIDTIESLKAEVVDLYTDYGNSDPFSSGSGNSEAFAQVPVFVPNEDDDDEVGEEFPARKIREHLREIPSVIAQLDIDGPDIFDDRVDVETARVDALRETTFVHEEFYTFAEQTVKDLELLREIEFRAYHDALDRYDQGLDEVDDDLDDLREVLRGDAVDQATASIAYEDRADTFGRDIEAMSEMKLALENLHSAAEWILMGYAAEDDSTRREYRLNARSRINDARNILEDLDAPTAGAVVDEVNTLADDLQEAADEV